MKSIDEVSPILKAALEIRRKLGWCPVPLIPGTKTPCVKGFTQWRNPPPEDAIRRWFSKDRGLGVVLGPVSGNLAVMDFDTADGFHNWQEQHPDLAENVPRSRTKRGHQVFFSTTDEAVGAVTGSKSRTLNGDGADLKFNGLTVPPSLHHSGVTYTWEVEPWEGIHVIHDLCCWVDSTTQK